MNQKYKILAIVVSVVVIASAGVGVGLYLNHNGLTKIYDINVKEANGTVVNLDLSSVGGYAYVPTSSNGAWVINGTLNRIISLIPSATTTLYALHAYGDVVGVDQYSVYPAPTKNVSVFNLEQSKIPIEAMANLTPDAIITTTGYFSTQDINQVVNVLGIPYVVLEPGNFSQIENQNTLLGYLTGTQGNAKLVNNWMNVNMQNLKTDLSPLNGKNETSVFYDLGPGVGGGLYTAGNGTFINDIFNMDHVRNVINESGFPSVPISVVYNSTPDYVILDQYVNTTSMNSTLSGLSAVKNGKYISIANDTFFDESDFRSVYAAYWLAEQLFPQYVNMSMMVGFNSSTGLGLSPAPGVGVNS